MPKKNEITIAGKSFEELKQVNEYGAQYWSARALQPMLAYSQWRRFEQAIERAITSCKESGNPPEHHFAGAGKPIHRSTGDIANRAVSYDVYHGLGVAMKNKSIVVQGTEITIATRHEQDYISLTDMVRNFDGGSALIEQWLKNKNTVLFLRVWEQLNNSAFNSLEFEGIRNEAGRNSFFLSAKKWIEATGAEFPRIG